jgi:hypothetical protein
MKEKKEAAQKNKVIESFKHDHKPLRFRFFAAVVDCVVITFICQFIGIIFGTPDWGKYLQMQTVIIDLARDDPLVLERMNLFQEYFIISLIIGLVYDSLMMILFKAPIGKLIFGFRVIDTREDRSFLISKLLLVLRAAIKALSIYLLSAIPFIFMCLTTFGNIEQRSGFDMFSGTKIIKVNKRRNGKEQRDEDFSENGPDG